MIDWNSLAYRDCDAQVDSIGKCLVVDIPVDRSPHPNPRVQAMIVNAVAKKKALGQIPVGTTRCRFSADGGFTVHTQTWMGIPDWYVKQREKWDCGVACIAMALRLSYEEALRRFDNLRLPDRKPTGYYSGEIARILGATEWYESKEYTGSLEKCILNVIQPGSTHGHFIYVEDGLWCPCGTITWGMFTIRRIVPVEKHHYIKEIV